MLVRLAVETEPGPIVRLGPVRQTDHHATCPLLFGGRWSTGHPRRPGSGPATHPDTGAARPEAAGSEARLDPLELLEHLDLELRLHGVEEQ